MPTRWLKNLTVNWKKIINRFLLLRLIQLWSKLNNTNHLHELYGEYKFKYHNVLRAIEELGKIFDSYIAHLLKHQIMWFKEILRYVILTAPISTLKNKKKMKKLFSSTRYAKFYFETIKKLSVITQLLVYEFSITFLIGNYFFNNVLPLPL